LRNVCPIEFLDRSATIFRSEPDISIPWNGHGTVVTMPLKSCFVAEVITFGSRGDWKKLKQSSMSFASASRSVRGCNPNFFSINFSGDVKSNLVCTTADTGVREQVSQRIERINARFSHQARLRVVYESA
jgi:hypothetical protein